MSCIFVMVFLSIACQVITREVRSHNAAIGMNIIITEQMDSLIRDGRVCLVREVSVYTFIKAMPVVVIGRRIRRLV